MRCSSEFGRPSEIATVMVCEYSVVQSGNLSRWGVPPPPRGPARSIGRQLPIYL